MGRDAVTDEFVFAYGSLASWGRAGSGPQAAFALRIATLADAHRAWGVAMDNARTIPGYKYHVDPVTGARPAVAVTFLDLVDADRGCCVGFLVPVASAAALASLDARERNYDRVDVTARVSCVPALASDTRVWAYRGTDVSRARCARALAAGSAVVQRGYLEGVEAEFAARGLLERYRASTRPPECPVRDLVRVDVPD